MSKTKIVFSILGVLVLIVALGFATNLLNLGMFKFFAPKYEEAKRDVFMESKEFLNGTMQELNKMRLEHLKTKDPDIKAMLEKRALNLVAEVDKDKLTQDLREWLYEIEQNEINR